MNRKLIFASLFTSLVLFSCGEKVEEYDAQVTTDSLSDAVRTSANLVRISIPSPTVIGQQLSRAKYNFDAGVLNPSSKASSYSSKYDAAANLGVYGADLGYAGSYNQSQSAMEYLAQVGRLAKVVGIESAFDENFAKDIAGTAGKGDSLVSMVDQAFAKAERNLRSNDRAASAAIIVGGGWIEGLYIASNIIGSRTKDSTNEEAYHTIFSHSNSFKYVLDLLAQYKNDADCAKMAQEFQSLTPIVDVYGRKPDLSQQDVMEIKKLVTPVRNRITN